MATTTGEATRLPKTEQKKAEANQQEIERIHDIDNREYDYIVAPFKDPDIKGMNSQTTGGLGRNTPGNGYTTVVNADYYGDGTHAMLARKKNCPEATEEKKERLSLFPRLPKGNIKTVIEGGTNVARDFLVQDNAEVLRPGNVNMRDEERQAELRKQKIMNDPEQAAVLERMTASAGGLMSSDDPE